MFLLRLYSMLSQGYVVDWWLMAFIVLMIIVQLLMDASVTISSCQIIDMVD